MLKGNYEYREGPIDEFFVSSWCETKSYIKQNPDNVYSSFAHSLQPIIEQKITLVL